MPLTEVRLTLPLSVMTISEARRPSTQWFRETEGSGMHRVLFTERPIEKASASLSGSAKTPPHNGPTIETSLGMRESQYSVSVPAAGFGKHPGNLRRQLTAAWHFSDPWFHGVARALRNVEMTLDTAARTGRATLAVSVSTARRGPMLSRSVLSHKFAT